MTSDGQILGQGSLSNVLSKDNQLFMELEDNSKNSDKTREDGFFKYEKKSDGKLIKSEELSEGHVGWSAGKFGNLYILYNYLTWI